MTNPIALDLLKLAEHYLSALHGSVARHDNIGLNLSCGGCALRDEIRDVLPKLAAVPAAVSVPPPAPRADDRAAVRDRIARAIFGAHSPGIDVWDTAGAHAQAVCRAEADAVLAVLPEPADRAAVLREAANALAAVGLEDSLVSGPRAWAEAIETLRRMADEAQQPEPEAEPTAEDIARANVLALHQIGEQLAGIESWFWEHLADVRETAKAKSDVAGEQKNETPEAVVARVLYVAEVIEANGIGWAADSIRRACRGDAEQPRTCGHCGQVHASSSLTHFGAPGGPWYCVDRDDCRGAGGLPPRKPAAAPAVVAQSSKETQT